MIRATFSYLVATGLIAAFWVTAVLSDFFLDRPFVYTTEDEWSSNFVRSSARFLSHPEAGLHLAAGAFLLPAIVCLAARLSVGARDPFELAWAKLGASTRHVALGLSVLAALFAALVSFAIIDGVDLIDDERSYLFQASLFARGLLKLPPPPRALLNPMILLSPAWMSKYPPGHSAALLLGVLLRAPRAVPPVLGGLLVYVSYEFVREIYDERQGLLVAALLAASTFLWCTAGTMMAFPTFACAFIAALWLFARGRKRGGAWNWAGSGALLGFAATVRPFDALALGLPLGVWLLRDVMRASPERRWSVLPFAAGAAPLVAALLAYNLATTGSPFQLGYRVANDYSFGFFTHSIRGFGYEHTPGQGIAQAVTAITRLDLWLLGWPASLLFALAGALTASGVYDRLVLSLLATFAVAYTLVASPGTWDVGPTYYFAIAPLVVVLVVRGIRALRTRMIAVPSGVRFVGWLPVVGGCVAMVTIAPMHLVRLSVLSAEIDAPWRAVAESDLGESIVVVPLRRAAAGYALGFPYEIKTKTGTAHLVRPDSPASLDDARQFLGASLPVFQLAFDEETFRRDGLRRFEIKPLS